MKIVFTKRYEKEYKKLDKKSKEAADKALLLFRENPNDPKLDNHALLGKLKGYRSIDAGFDLRIQFYEEDGYVYVFLVRVGSHSQLYK